MLILIPARSRSAEMMPKLVNQNLRRRNRGLGRGNKEVNVRMQIHVTSSHRNRWQDWTLDSRFCRSFWKKEPPVLLSSEDLIIVSELVPFFQFPIFSRARSEQKLGPGHAQDRRKKNQTRRDNRRRLACICIWCYAIFLDDHPLRHSHFQYKNIPTTHQRLTPTHQTYPIYTQRTVIQHSQCRRRPSASQPKPGSS